MKRLRNGLMARILIIEVYWRSLILMMLMSVIAFFLHSNIQMLLNITYFNCCVMLYWCIWVLMWKNLEILLEFDRYICNFINSYFSLHIYIQINSNISKMVVLHYKKTDHNQFLYEVPGATLVAQVIDDLVQINNMRIQLDIYACSLEELATHGPLKPEEIRGLNDQELIDNALIVSSPDKKKWAIKRLPVGDERFNEDSTHYRIGVIKNQQLTKMMIETSNKAKKMISYKRVQFKEQLNLKELIQMKQELHAALKIAYPNFEGLGEWEPARRICENQYQFEDMNTDQVDYLSPKKSTLWWAGKQLHPQKPLNNYTGKNQKTKIIVKITKTGSGAPAREGGIDEETKVKMMAMYHKKQEQLKKIETNNEDDFKNSSWANPNNLKNYLVNGGQGVKFRGK